MTDKGSHLPSDIVPILLNGMMHTFLSAARKHPCPNGHTGNFVGILKTANNSISAEI